MELYQELFEKYSKKLDEYHKEQKRIDEKIIQRENQIDRLKRKKSKQVYPHFLYELIEPIAKEYVRIYPEYKYDLFGPFGITCECSIHFFKKSMEEVSRDEYFSPSNIFSISFVPSSEKGLLYKTGEKKNTFAKGSIGYANNMNDVTAPVDSFKVIENILNLRKPKENEQQEKAI